MKTTFAIYRQLDAMDCDPTCLPIAAEYHGMASCLHRMAKWRPLTSGAKRQG